MTKHIPHKTHDENSRRNRYPLSRHEVESMLREIAFVLKMTQKVRHEMDVEKGAAEPVLA